MSADSSIRIQANFKLASGDLFNVYGTDGPEFLQVIEFLAQNAQAVTSAGDALRGVQQVAGVLAPAKPVQQEQGGWQNQQAAPPQFAQQQAQAQNGGAPAPSCRHGERVFREGVGKQSGKPYKAYFCPSRDRNDQCDAQFIR